MNRDEITGGGLVFLFGAVTVYLSVKMPVGTFRSAGSGLFPLCLGIILMLLAGAFVLRILLGDRRRVEVRESKITVSARRVAPFLGAIVAATLLFRVLGYPLMAFLLLLALLRILGMKRWVWNVLLSFATAAVSYGLFVQWLKIPLPKGWIGL